LFGDYPLLDTLSKTPIKCPPLNKGRPMSLTETCLAQFKKEIASVRKAPFTFLIAVAIASLLGSGGLYWVFNWEMWNFIEMKKALIAALTEENDRLKSSKDVKQRSETEEKQEKKDLVVMRGDYSHMNKSL
jgi:hypothetical protein